MPYFSERSKAVLSTAHPKLRQLFDVVVASQDCTILCGFRNEEAQEDAFVHGFSKVQWPHSKHNHYPSDAIDVVPYPLDWKDLKKFYFFAGYVHAVAEKLGMRVRWGGDFNQDGNLNNDPFIDLPHWEIIHDPLPIPVDL